MSPKGFMAQAVCFNIKQSGWEFTLVRHPCFFVLAIQKLFPRNVGT